MTEDLLAMARAAQHDDRLADGALYGKLADKIEQAQKALREADIYLSVLLAEVADPVIQKGMRATLDLIDAARKYRGPDCACCEQQPRKDCTIPDCTMKNAEWALPSSSLTSKDSQ